MRVLVVIMFARSLLVGHVLLCISQRMHIRTHKLSNTGHGCHTGLRPMTLFSVGTHSFMYKGVVASKQI
jgi:hypothetical protein